jgi:O-antigen ligase
VIAAFLVLLVAAGAPWGFGCVDPWWASLLVLGCLVPASCALVRDALAGPRRDDLPRSGRLLLCLLPLPALVGLVPVPASLHALLVPGGAEVLSGVPGADGARTIALHARSALEAACLSAAYAAAFFVVARAAREPRVRAAAATILAASGAALALFGLWQERHQTDPPTLYGTVAISEVTTPYGPYVNRNHFGGALQVLLGVAAGEALSAWSRGRRLLALPSLAAVAAMLAALADTRSRGSVVGAAAGGAFLLLFAARSQRLRGAAAAAALLGAVGVLFLWAGWLDRLLGFLRVNPRWSLRFAAQADALAAFAANPWVGTGAGGFAEVFPVWQRVRDVRYFGNAHSDWAQFLMETGLLGAGVAAAAGRGLVRAVSAGLARAGSDRWRILGPAAGAAALAVHGFLDVNLHVPANALLASVALSLAYAASLGPPDPAAGGADPREAGSGAGTGGGGSA